MSRIVLCNLATLLRSAMILRCAVGSLALLIVCNVPLHAQQSGNLASLPRLRGLEPAGSLPMNAARQNNFASPAQPPSAMPSGDVFSQPQMPEQVFWEDQLPQPPSQFTPEWKPNWLQEFRFIWNANEGGKGSSMGETELALEPTFAVPWIIRGSPWLITPHFGVHLLRGPEVIDMPGHLYDVSLEFGRLLQITPGLQLETAYAPSIYSDFDQGRSEAFRVTGRLVGYQELNKSTQIVFGAMYLGRYDYPVLPVAGLVYSPNELLRVDLVFPRPKVQRRIFLPPAANRVLDMPLVKWLGFDKQDRYWVYLRGDLGGNTYAIRRANGDSDMVTYRDFRVSLGYERRSPLGFVNRSEICWAFGRDLKYQSSPDFVDLGNALMLRSDYAF